jgi:phage-related protein
VLETALTVGELVGYLRIDSSGWHVELASARTELSRTARTTSTDLERMADRAAKGFVRVALAMSNLTTAGAALHGVASTAGALGAAMAVLPAAGVAVGVGMAAAKVGMAGFGDAMKNVGDPAAFAESLERLSPAARETATAVRDLGPAWRSVQQATQEALFAGVADDVRALGGRYLPVLETGLSGVASEFNRAARGTAAFLGESRQVETVAGIFGQVRTSVGGVSDAVQPLVSILLDLVAVGSEFLPGLAGGFADAAQRAAEFIHEARQTGELHQWIAEGLETLRQLGQLLANIGGIAGAVFDGLGLGGAGLLDTLVRLTGQVRAFLESVEGQRALAAFGEVLATVSDVVGEVFLTALQQLAPVVAALGPGFAELTRQVGDLVAALTLVGPLLTELATFLSQNVYWLGPLIIGLYSGVKAFEAITAAVKLFTAASNLNPWVAIISATIALATLIITNWDQITAALGVAWDWISARASEVWGWVTSVVVDNVNYVVDWVSNGINQILSFFDWLGSLPGKVSAWFAGVRDGANRRLGELVDWVRGLPGRILGALGDLGSLLVDAGKNILRGLLNGLKSMADTVIGWFRDLIDMAVDAALDVLGIASPSKVFHKIGVWSGQGLVDGLASMVDPVTGAATTLANAAVAAPALPASAVAAPAPAAAGPPGPSPATTGFGGVGAAIRAPLHIEHYHAPPDADPAEQAQAWDWLSRGGG